MQSHQYSDWVQVPSSAIKSTQWFWSNFEDYCVPDCCGLGAYNFEHDSVRSAAGAPEFDFAPSLRHSDEERSELVSTFTELAGLLKEADLERVCVGWLNDIMSSAKYAELFSDLAWKVETPS